MSDVLTTTETNPSKPILDDDQFIEILSELSSLDEATRQQQMERLAHEYPNKSLDYVDLLPKIQDLLQHEDDHVKQTALAALTQLSPEDGLKIIRDMDGDTPWKNRQKGAELLGQHGEEKDRDKLLSFLGDDDGDVRESALRGLFAYHDRLPPEQANEAKLSLSLGKLTDHHNGVVSVAVGMLEGSEDPKIHVEKVEQSLQHGHGSGAGRLLEFLQKHASQKATDYYDTIPKVSDSGARLSLVKVLAEHHPSGYEELFETLWGDADWDIRLLSYHELYRRQPERRLELSIRALDDQDNDIHLAVLDNLQEHGGKEVIELLLPRFQSFDTNSRLKVLRMALTHRVGDIAELAHKVLEYEGWSERRDLIVTMGESGNPDVLEVILERLKNDSDDDVQAAALEAAIKLAPEQVSKMVQFASQSRYWRVRQRGAECAGKYGSEEHLQFIEKLLKDDDWDVRQAAMRAILQLSPKEKQLELAIEKIADDSPSVAQQAHTILQETDDKDKLFSLIDAKFESLAGSSAQNLLTVIESHEPEKLDSYIKRIPNIENASARSSMAHKLLELEQPSRIDVWKQMLNDDNSDVRSACFVGLFQKHTSPEEVESLLDQALADPYYSIRAKALQHLAGSKSQENLSRVIRMLQDSDDDVRVAAMQAATSLDDQNPAQYARSVLSDGHWKVREHAAMMLMEVGDANDVAKLQLLLSDDDNDVRLAAFNACLTLAPDHKVELAIQCLVDSDGSVTERARAVLDEVEGVDLVQLAIEKLPHINNAESTEFLLNLVEQREPSRLAELRPLVTTIANESARERIVEQIFQADEEVSMELLRTLQSDSSSTIRKQVFDSLWERLPGERTLLATEALKDESWVLRMAGVEALRDDPDPSHIDDLLPLARDADYDVRREALRTLSQHSDIRVFGELVSAMDDVNDEVKAVAEECLKKARKSPMLSRMIQAKTGIPIWVQIRQEIDDINKWATQTGHELLGKPICVVQPNHQEEEQSQEEKEKIIKIEISEKPVTWCHPNGADVMRGMALYKIGHYLCNDGERGFKTMTGIARSEGIQDIYEVLTSERVDRNLRSRRSEWREPLDHLASYAFSKNIYRIPITSYAEITESTSEAVLEAVQTGALPGQLLPIAKTHGVQMVSLRDRDLLRIPNALPPLIAFVWCLRCGFEAQQHPNPKVEEAIALVPQNLRTLPHSKVLQVAREIAELLGKNEQCQQDMQKMMQKMNGCGGAAKRCMGGNLQRLDEAGFLPEAMSQMGQDGQAQDAPCRKKRQVVYERPPRSMQKLSGGQTLNLGPDLDYPPIQYEKSLAYDREKHSLVVGSIRKNIRRLRSYFERLGRRTIDEYALRRGHRIDHAMARRSIFTNTPNLLVHSTDELFANLYLGILIDRSGSMDGEKLEVAKRFGALVAESARGLRGIVGHVNAFDDDTFYHLGDFQRNAIACLESGGSNNDAGALQKAAELALYSRKRNRLLVMISDGSPTECSVDALRSLVEKLTKDYGIVCAQVAVEPLSDIAFPHYIDLSEYNTEEAVTRFGSLLMKLTQIWR